MIVREIKTKVVPVLDEEKKPVMKDGQPVTKIVPELDAKGKEIELFSVHVPQKIEAKGAAAIEDFVAKEKAKHHKPAKEK